MEIEDQDKMKGSLQKNNNLIIESSQIVDASKSQDEPFNIPQKPSLKIKLSKEPTGGLTKKIQTYKT